MEVERNELRVWWEEIYTIDKKTLITQCIRLNLLSPEYNDYKVDMRAIRILKDYQDIKEEARKHINLKKGFDLEEETYYNSHNINKYNSFIDGALYQYKKLNLES